MPITRRDIVSKVFTSVGGGYDADEVDAFLDLVADTLELRDDALNTERQRVALLTAEIRRLDAQIADLKKNAARTENADAEARELLEQAKLQARMVISAAREEAKKLVDEAKEQAELIVKKAAEKGPVYRPLSERIAGFALRSVEPEEVNEHSEERQQEAETPLPQQPVLQPEVSSAALSQAEPHGEAAPSAEVLAEAEPEVPDAPKGDEGAQEPVGEHAVVEAEPFALTPAEAHAEQAAEPIDQDPRTENTDGQQEESAAEKSEATKGEVVPLFGAEVAEPPLPSDFPKAERPAEFRPRLEIARPPRPEDVFDDSEGIYPSTDWLKNPDSRYDKD
ncbi:MAG: DivIVA domain-containing protein [Christensenellales bacterium]|jgi:DivIVA domain-containing protein